MTTASEKDILNEVQIEEALTELPGWEYQGMRLVKRFKLKTFMDSMEFVNDVAAVAEELNHHPDILISFTKVKFQLWTHKFESVTTLDVQLAKRINDVGMTHGLP